MLTLLSGQQPSSRQSLSQPMVPLPPFDVAFTDASSTIPGAHGGAGTCSGDLDAAETDLEPPIPRLQSRRTGLPASSRLLAFLTTLVLFVLFAAPTQAASIDSRAVVLDGRPTRVLQERGQTFNDFAPTLTKRQEASTCACSETGEAHNGTFVVEAIFIPVLVLLSGAFAGLTLGYMSLDSTQLNVLSKSGTEKQKRLAQKIIPIRKDGHLLLITLLIANM